MKISIELPFFPGFYETDYFNSDTEYYAIKEELDYYQTELVDEHPEYELLTMDDLDFDFKEYCNDVTSSFIYAWKDNAPKDIVESVEFDELESPRYYNFRNDRLFAFVTLKDGWEDAMRKFMTENKDWLKERIHKDWTSYDGFWSHMENDSSRWDKELFEEHDERYIGTMIGYMMYKEDNDIRYHLYCDTMEDIYEGSYVYIIKERENEDKKNENK